MGGTAAAVQDCAYVRRWLMGEPGAVIALWVGDFGAAVVRQLESEAADAKAEAEHAVLTFESHGRIVEEEARWPFAPVHDRRRRALGEAAYAAARKATSAGAKAKQARTAVGAYAVAAVGFVRRSAHAGRSAEVTLEVVSTPATTLSRSMPGFWLWTSRRRPRLV